MRAGPFRKQPPISANLIWVRVKGTEEAKVLIDIFQISKNFIHNLLASYTTISVKKDNRDQPRPQFHLPLYQVLDSADPRIKKRESPGDEVVSTPFSASLNGHEKAYLHIKITLLG